MIKSSKKDIAAKNFDITEKKKVGFGHIQKINIFHKLPEKPEFFIEKTESLAEVAK